MQVLELLIAGSVLCYGFAPPAAAQSAEAPPPWNLVFVYVDDLNTLVDLPAAEVPHLHELAQRGVRFQRAYAAHPLCSPSRTALLSGQLAHHTQITSNADVDPPLAVQGVPYLPLKLKEAGYHTAGIGKIHHEPQAGCWDEYHDFIDDPWIVKPVVPHDPAFTGMITGGPFLNGPDGALGHMADEHRTTKALALLDEGKARLDATGQPFSLWLGLEATHAPFVSPEKFLGHAVAEDMPPLPAGELELPWPLGVCPQSYKTNAFYDPVWGPGEAEKRIQALLAYVRCIAFVDEQLGRVLGRLDLLGLTESTIVVFVGDHGWSFSEHAHIGKPSGFEEDIVAPLLLAVPSLPETHGQTVTAPVSQVDLYPTLMELLKLSEPGPLDGRSLVPLLHDVAAPHAPALYTTDEEGGFNLTRFVVRRDEDTGDVWKLAAWEHDDKTPQIHELYELRSDPGEYHNRAAEPGLQPLVGELRQVLADAGLLGPGWRHFRSGTAGSAGVPALDWSGVPLLGSECVLQLGNPAGVPAAGLLLIGFDGTGSPSSTLAVKAHSGLVLGVGAAGLLLPVSLPADPVLHEFPIGLQLLLQDPTAPHGIATSRGLALFPSF